MIEVPTEMRGSVYRRRAAVNRMTELGMSGFAGATGEPSPVAITDPANGLADPVFLVAPESTRTGPSLRAPFAVQWTQAMAQGVICASKKAMRFGSSKVSSSVYFMTPGFIPLKTRL